MVVHFLCVMTRNMTFIVGICTDNRKRWHFGFVLEVCVGNPKYEPLCRKNVQNLLWANSVVRLDYFRI